MSWRLVVRGVCALWLVPFSVGANSIRIQSELNSIEHLSAENKIESNSGARASGPLAPPLIPRSSGGSGSNASEKLNSGNSGGPKTAGGSVRSTNAGASPRSSLADLVAPHCGKNLYPTLCSGQSPRAEESVVGPRIKEFQKSFAKAQGIRFLKLQALFSNGIRHSQDPHNKQMYAAYFEHLKASMPPLDGIFNRAKQFLDKAIDKMPLSDSARVAMHEKLSHLHGSLSPNLDKDYEVEEWGSNCQPDGMAPTAYARPEEKDVIICPGLMMRALALGGTEELEHYMLHAIGHECMHHMGADTYRNSSGQITGESPFRPEFAGALSCLASSNPGIDPVRMGGEIAADLGSSKAMAERLRGSTPEQALKFLRASMGPLCGTKNDGVHPDDKFRINVILGQDPDLAMVLGCPVPAQSCSEPKQTVQIGKPPTKGKKIAETAARAMATSNEEPL